MVSESAPRVLFVKKILADGRACRKCRDIDERLHRDGLAHRVDDTLVIHEEEPVGPGARLADSHGVKRAPFFVLRYPDGREHVIESYLAFKRWFSDSETTTHDLADMVEQHPDLAFL
jgi:hypothetical protein